MSVKKKLLSGKAFSWGYEFAVGSRGDRQRYKQGGFATRSEAINAESAKRLEIERGETTKDTSTLGAAIEKFFADRGETMSPKTLDRYRELANYLSPNLTAMPISKVRAMDLHEEWRRLLASGGHDGQHGIIPTVPCTSCGAEIRQSCRDDETALHRAHDARRNDWLAWQVAHPETARPLSAKTVRNVASVVSSACSWAVLYGLISTNPATASKPPSGPKRKGLALAPSQVDLMVQAASATWLMDFLEVEAGLGIRRGEALALRWSDIVDGVASITRSLCQVRQTLHWKGTKTGEERNVKIPGITMAAFERHRAEQAKARAAFPDYNRSLDLVFADPGGDPLKPDSVSSKVSLLCRKLKLPEGTSLHTLRHSHFSQLVADGADVGAVAARAGHANAGTTLGIYTHAIPGKSDLSDQWEKLQGKKSAPVKTQ
jgi:integrase